MKERRFIIEVESKEQSARVQEALFNHYPNLGWGAGRNVDFTEKRRLVVVFPVERLYFCNDPVACSKCSVCSNKVHCLPEKVIKWGLPPDRWGDFIGGRSKKQTPKEDLLNISDLKIPLREEVYGRTTHQELWQEHCLREAQGKSSVKFALENIKRGLGGPLSYDPMGGDER